MVGEGDSPKDLRFCGFRPAESPANAVFDHRKEVSMNANRPVAALVAATTLLSSVGAAYGAQHDDRDSAAIVAVGEACSAAGLARFCSVDPQPIAAAVAQLFYRLELDPAAKAKALARYRANEAQMTVNVRDQLKAPFCADRYLRSEERRVGKECRSRWAPGQY